MGCGAAVCSSRTCSTERGLDDLVGTEERFENIQKLGGVPFGRAFDLTEYSSFPIDQKGSRQTLDLESPSRGALWIEVSLDRFKPELVDKRLHCLAAAAVLRYRDDGDLVTQTQLHPREGWHLAQTRLAPGGPEIDKDDPAGEFGEADRVPGQIDKRDRGRRQRR